MDEVKGFTKDFMEIVKTLPENMQVKLYKAKDVEGIEEILGTSIEVLLGK